MDTVCDFLENETTGSLKDYFAIYDISTEEELFRGDYVDMDSELEDYEVISFDFITYPTPYIILNVETE